MIYTNLLNTKAVEKNNDTLEIEFANHMTSFGKTVLNNRENIDFIAKTVEAVAGKNLKIQYSYNIIGNNKCECGRKTEKTIEMGYGEILRLCNAQPAAKL